MAELHAGNTSLTWRSLGLYAFTKHRADIPARSFTRDFELEGRTRAAALAVRGRYRDLDTGDVHLRDIVLAIGLQPFVRRGFYETLPAFVGLGIRRELARSIDTTDGIARRVSQPSAPWQLLVWLELDLGLEHRGRSDHSAVATGGSSSGSAP